MKKTGIIKTQKTATLLFRSQSFFHANSYLDKRLRHKEKDYAELQQFVNSLFEYSYAEHGFTIDAEDDLLDVLHKKNIITTMGKYGYEDCVTTAKVQFIVSPTYLVIY